MLVYEMTALQRPYHDVSYQAQEAADSLCLTLLLRGVTGRIHSVHQPGHSGWAHSPVAHSRSAVYASGGYLQELCRG